MVSDLHHRVSFKSDPNRVSCSFADYHIITILTVTLRIFKLVVVAIGRLIVMDYAAFTRYRFRREIDFA